MNDIADIGGTAVPARAGQATMVEQARVIAEVRAAVMIAMEQPRDRTGAMVEMRETCGIMGLAERAFFRVPRGAEMINGESIHLARELARVWGNIAYGVKELARDDIRGQSELVAFAWDLQTNARSEITFIVPHTRGKGKRLTGTQEIYENNASFAGRRLREAIFAVLPVWFKAEAAELCHQTLANGGGKPLVQRIADLRTAFEAIGVSVAQLEQKRGRKIDGFLPEDVAGLRVVYGSIKRGEVTIGEEFPAVESAESPRAGDKMDALERLAGPEGHRAPSDATTAETSPAAPEDEEDAFGLRPLPQDAGAGTNDTETRGNDAAVHPAPGRLAGGQPAQGGSIPDNPRGGPEPEPGGTASARATPAANAPDAGGGRTVGSIPATGADLLRPRDPNFWNCETLVLAGGQPREFQAEMHRRLREAQTDNEVCMLRDHNGEMIDALPKSYRDDVLGALIDRQRELRRSESAA